MERKMYKGVCGCEYDVQNKEPEPDLFSPEQIEAFIAAIYSGAITVLNPDVNLYRRIANYLEGSVFKGYGATLYEFTFNSPDYMMLEALRRNTYVFSAAKTFQQTREIADLVYEGDRIRGFSEFKRLAIEIYDDYNVNWLKSEYNLANASSRMAARWVQIVKDKETLPLLKYDTAGDSRVRPEHSVLDGVIRPVDDAFWNTWYPPNDWGCRCDVQQLDEGEVTKMKDIERPEQSKLFAMNPGKDRLIFKEDHPYFKVDEKYEVLKDNNFNLPLL